MCLVSLLVMASCARLPPESSPVLPEAGQLQDFHRVALSVSASEIQVRYARQDESILIPLLMFTAPYVGLLTFVADAAIEHGVGASRDRIAAARWRDAAQEGMIRDTMSRYVMEEVNKKACFRVDPCQDRDPPRLAADGYDGLLHVKLKEIYFQREGTSNKVRIYVRGTGTLTKLAGGSIVWTREELATGDQSRTIAEYAAEEGRLFKEDFDGLLRRLSTYLTRDFAYVQ